MMVLMNEQPHRVSFVCIWGSKYLRFVFHLGNISPQNQTGKNIFIKKIKHTLKGH